MRYRILERSAPLSQILQMIGGGSGGRVFIHIHMRRSKPTLGGGCGAMFF
jgi:hypothetical protein